MATWCGHVQDANKGCFFQSLPPVLELHLKRFVYDFQRDRNFKALRPFRPIPPPPPHPHPLLHILFFIVTHTC
jgi:hypothetical protein